MKQLYILWFPFGDLKPINNLETKIESEQHYKEQQLTKQMQCNAANISLTELDEGFLFITAHFNNMHTLLQ